MIATPSIAVIGAGAIGHALVVDLASRGMPVSLLVDIDEQKIAALSALAEMQCTGLCQSSSVPMPAATTDVASAACHDYILVATTADRHDDVAHALAGLLRRDHLVLLLTGYADGAANFIRNLRAAGDQTEPLVIELNTTPYLSASLEPGSVHIAGRKRWMEAAGSDFERLSVHATEVQRLIPGAELVSDGLISSLNNPNPVAHVPAYLGNLNVVADGAMATASRGGAFYLDDFVFPEIAALRQQVDVERLSVLAALGAAGRGITRIEFSARAYGNEGRETPTARFGKTFPPRFLSEDVPCGLVPIESLGLKTGVATPLISAMITLAGAVAHTDWRAHGRSVDQSRIPSRKSAVK